MRGTRPSWTAQNIALARAWLTHAGIVDDPWAERWLRPAWRRCLVLLRRRWLARLGRNRPFTFIGARTRFYDTLVTEAIDAGIDQVVLLAAGYDSRSWRLARPGVRFFEVDHPATQADKRSRAPADGPAYVPADLAVTALDDVLPPAGFDCSRPTVFCCEGLTMYLPEVAVGNLLTSVARQAAPGSRLGVDFARRPGAPARSRAVRLAVWLHGEPIDFELHPNEADGFLSRSGWTAEEILTGEAMHARFLQGTGLPELPDGRGAFVAAASLRPEGRREDGPGRRRRSSRARRRWRTHRRMPTYRG